MTRRWVAGALVALLLLPVASAQASLLEIELDDHAGDTVDRRGRRVEAPGADILRFTSAVENAIVIQRVEMNGTPQPPYDWILVRSWFANSTNGSYHTVDIEVTPTPRERGQWVQALIRDGDYFAAKRLPLEWRIENATWVFAFDALAVANATCFDPGIFTKGFGGEDALYANQRGCVQTSEPATPTGPPPRLNVSIVGDAPAQATPSVEPPGSRTPTPALPVGALALVGLGLALARRRR